jgi:hypothetical protein
MIEILEIRKVVWREPEQDHAVQAARDHASRIKRQARNAEILAHLGTTIGGADAIIDVAALLDSPAQAYPLQGLGDPGELNGILAILHRKRLHKEDRFQFGGAGGLGLSHRGKRRQRRGAQAKDEKTPYTRGQMFCWHGDGRTIVP